MMDCNSFVINGAEHFSEFCSRAARLRIPISGAIEITQRCNLRCVHCYLGSARYRQDVSRPEMDKHELFVVLDEIRDAGCLHLLLTGGEPLLRPDFGGVYEHAKRNGMIVTIFTNGTLINPGVVDLFDDLPPKLVEISLYGATMETYERVAGVPGSFRSCMEGIESLLERGVNVALKTILMSVNSHEFYDIERIAKSYGVKFRFDAAILPCFDGDKSPLSLRVPVDDAVDKELSNEGRFAAWKKYVDKSGDVKLNDRLYGCGSGVTNFHIDPGGFLMPCIMVKHMKYDLLAGNFVDGWMQMPYLSELKARPDRRCNDCRAVILCGYCPGFSLIEKGDENLISDYLCDMGKARFSAVCK